MKSCIYLPKIESKESGGERREREKQDIRKGEEEKRKFLISNSVIFNKLLTWKYL